MTASPAPADLRAPRTDPWAGLSIPQGWEPIAAVAHEVADSLEGLATAIVRAIADEIPAYDGGGIPYEDVTSSVVRNLDMILVGIAESRGPRPEELAIRRELGSRRAAQGLPIDALIQAYHVGYRELWQAMVRSVPAGDTATANQLLQAATTVWRWVHEVTNAIAEAHAETVRSREAHAIGARQRLVELVVGGDLTAEEAGELAAGVGFDVTGSFRAVLAHPPAVEGSEPRDLQRRLGDLGGVHAIVQRGPAIVLLLQGTEMATTLAALERVLPDAAIGIGLERAGLTGARASVGDAERSVALSRGGAVAFEEAWLDATLLRAAPRLEALFEGGTELVTEHPHLAETVEAYAASGFSVSQTARSLDLHANTIGYRLDRWRELSGWDPRTFGGLTRSLAAILLASTASSR